MLVVLAHDGDGQARAFVERWASHRVRLMTLKDLSARGWQHRVGGSGPERAVVGGEPVDIAALRGVISRIPGVSPAHLPHIVEADRVYVAAELNAFLVAWLNQLPCPVLNRPGPAAPLGPALSPERWGVLALRAGLPVARMRYDAPESALPPFVDSVPVMVVGGRWFGDVADVLGAHAVRLAEDARAELLTVRFSGAQPDAAFVSADPMVDLTVPPVAQAILERLGEGARA